MRTAILMTILCCGAFVGVADPQSLPTNALQTATRSVVRVNAANCAARDRSATGFIWPANTNVVTALHVVEGCSNLTVFSEQAGVLRTASVVKVLKRADLVLLKVDNAATLPAILVSESTPTVNDDLATLGYPLGIPLLNSTSLRLRLGGGKLKDIVPPNVAAELRAIGSPDVELDITNLEGHLLPGLSGAPILNRNGKVVAVADGGLENGFVGISWALPIKYLSQLTQSNEQLPSLTSSSQHLFATDLESFKGENIRCGSLDLTKVRTRNYNDIIHSTDDPAMVQQFATTSGIDPNTFQFDVYQHLSSGATVAVPRDAHLSPQGDGCRATLAGGNVEINVYLTIVNNRQDVQFESTTFESNSLISPKPMWGPDPSFTNPAPVTRFDGMTVRRKAFVQYRNLNNLPTAAKYLYETLAARERVFVGISALKHNYTRAVLESEQGCRLQIEQVSLSACDGINRQFHDWAESVIATQLTSFPIG